VKVHCPHDKLVSIKGLSPHPKNPNDHSQEQIARLAAILAYQGWRYPIKVSNLSGFVTSGHGRLLAAKFNGWEQVPVSYQDYENEEQEYADLVSDNAIAEWSVLDLKSINAEIEHMGPDFDIDWLGIKNFELDPADKYADQDEDHIPTPREAKVVPGELYLMGESRLLCGDATNPESWDRLMDGKKADMVFTDPPYNVAYTGKTKEGLQIQNDAMSEAEFKEFLDGTFVLMASNLKAGGAFYIAHADSAGHTFRQSVLDCGLLLKQCVIWVKQTFVMGRQDYHWQHEPILYGWAPGAAHTWMGDRRQSTVWNEDKPARNAEHPTMKPISLVERGILNSSSQNQLVVDPFGGSGSTLIASVKNGRRCNTMEIDPVYAGVILDRWAKYTGLDPVREDGTPWQKVKNG
jgi:DNA modification methylase